MPFPDAILAQGIRFKFNFFPPALSLGGRCALLMTPVLNSLQ